MLGHVGPSCEDWKLLDLFYQKREAFEYEDGKLLFYGRIIVPSFYINDIIQTYHNDGHFSDYKIRSSLLQKYWFFNMRKRIAEMSNLCEVCKKGKDYSQNRYKPQSLPSKENVEPLQYVSIDIVGPLPTQTSNYRWLLTIIDNATRWLEAIPLTNISADTVAKAFLRGWVYKFGPPAVIHSDNGKQFESDLFRSMFKRLGSEHSRTSIYHPQSNAICQRVHRTIADRIRCTKGSWLEILPRCVYNINRTHHDSIGCSPMGALLGRRGDPASDWPSISQLSLPIHNTSHPAVGDMVVTKNFNPSNKFQLHYATEASVVKRYPFSVQLSDGRRVNLRDCKTLSSKGGGVTA